MYSNTDKRLIDAWVEKCTVVFSFLELAEGLYHGDAESTGKRPRGGLFYAR
jgi:hypothetical protein